MSDPMHPQFAPQFVTAPGNPFLIPICSICEVQGHATTQCPKLEQFVQEAKKKENQIKKLVEGMMTMFELIKEKRVENVRLNGQLLNMGIKYQQEHQEKMDLRSEVGRLQSMDYFKQRQVRAIQRKFNLSDYDLELLYMELRREENNEDDQEEDNQPIPNQVNNQEGDNAMGQAR